ncbi:methionine synthase [Tomitella cavernea]|uniref:Methionine synthase n=1 Tax=Tomitella cavernea TaxID=1387982 RepID=A0ABP9CU37_9ACTN|nr:methionine synthase [Tomitella cavernea]
MTLPVTPPGAAATGVGSWPGTDEREAARTVVGELGELPHLVELPGRGIGADMVGRTAALLVDLPVDRSVTGYRLADRPGSVLRTARAHLARDLDAAEEACERAGVRGSGAPIKLQACGPVTAAVELELRTGRRVLTDRGAVRDLSASLAEGLREHVRTVRRRFGMEPVLQLDEPRLPDALAGAVPGPTRFDPVRILPEQEASGLLDGVIGAADGAPVLVHCCAPGVPLRLLRGLPVAGVSVPMTDVGSAQDSTGSNSTAPNSTGSNSTAQDSAAANPSVPDPSVLDALGEWLDSGRTLALGLVPARRPGGPPPDWHPLAVPAVRLVDMLGFARRILADQVLVTPECGLAGADPDWARTAVSLAGRIAGEFVGDPDAL